MSHRIIFDGLNLALEEGTAVTIYACSQVAPELG
jgi:hypothetical protein